MKIREKKTIAIDFDNADYESLDKVTENIATILTIMHTQNFNTLSGNYFEEPVAISIDDLKKALNIIEDIKYCTEIF